MNNLSGVEIGLCISIFLNLVLFLSRGKYRRMFFRSMEIIRGGRHYVIRNKEGFYLNNKLKFVDDLDDGVYWSYPIIRDLEFLSRYEVGIKGNENGFESLSVVDLSNGENTELLVPVKLFDNINEHYNRG